MNDWYVVIVCAGIVIFVVAAITLIVQEVTKVPKIILRQDKNRHPWNPS